MRLRDVLNLHDEIEKGYKALKPVDWLVWTSPCFGCGELVMRGLKYCGTCAEMYDRPA